MLKERINRNSSKKIFLFAGIVLFLSAVSAWAAFVTSGDYIVIAWNDLGMHCSNKDFSKLAVLPPYNNLEAQVIRKGSATSNPELVTSGVKLTYSIPGNTYSVGKTNFWTYAQSLFGVRLAPDVGLTGKKLKGTFAFDSAAGRFEAVGIPVTPYKDADLVNEDPYQLANIRLMDSSSNLLASTMTVIPVSNEMNCLSCHRSEAAIINEHEKVSGFDPSKPILCASCHQSNALGTPGIPEARSLSERMHSKHADETSNCYMCHPGPNTKCLRDVMSTASKMKCQDCHGGMSKVAGSIAQGRRPWLDEPDCGTCHGAKYGVERGKLYRNSKGHGGLYCSACHGSPHVIFPSRVARDNKQNIALQGYSGTLRECSVCHVKTPSGGGPHGA